MQKTKALREPEVVVERSCYDACWCACLAERRLPATVWLIDELLIVLGCLALYVVVMMSGSGCVSRHYC